MIEYGMIGNERSECEMGLSLTQNRIAKICIATSVNRSLKVRNDEDQSEERSLTLGGEWDFGSNFGRGLSSRKWVNGDGRRSR